MSLIKPKEKPCKGTGQATGFGCGKLTLHRKYGLGVMCCYPSWLYNSDAGKVKMAKSFIKPLKTKEPVKPIKPTFLPTIQKQPKSELSKALQNAQKVFNLYIRLRDKGKPCISSGVKWYKDFDAGHFFSVKQYSALRFDEFNVHAQSILDNRFKEGNFKEYDLRLKERIGADEYDKLLERAAEAKKTVKKWSVAEVEEIRKQYTQKINNLSFL